MKTVLVGPIIFSTNCFYMVTDNNWTHFCGFIGYKLGHNALKQGVSIYKYLLLKLPRKTNEFMQDLYRVGRSMRSIMQPSLSPLQTGESIKGLLKNNPSKVNYRRSLQRTNLLNKLRTRSSSTVEPITAAHDRFGKYL